MKAANASHALGIVFVDELARCGISDACLAPGSRSAPLALAMAADERISLHVVIDERSAAFMALGIARGSGRPAVVLSTSGTAAANFHAAVIEADHARVPLVVVTADRPPELRDTGANQTINQIKLFGDSVRWFKEVGVSEELPSSNPYWRSTIARAVALATGSPRGPVHLNVAFREPLVPEGTGWRQELEGRPRGAPWHSVARSATRPSEAVVEDLARRIAASERPLLVAGDGSFEPSPLLELAESAAMPVIAEPHSGLRTGPNAISAYDSLLRVETWADAHRPDLVLRVGKTGTSRALGAYLDAGIDQFLIDPDTRFEDPERVISTIVAADPSVAAGEIAKALGERERTEWLDAWRDAERLARRAIDSVLDAAGGLSEPRSARDLAAALPDDSSLVVASSMPVRDLDWFMAPRGDLRIFANRGASGIDGFVSTTLGIALTRDRPVAALAGDLSMLHDANGLTLDHRGAVDVVFVVINNDGGGIFSFLPQARFAESFEQLFGTPHGLDFAKYAELFGCEHALIQLAGDLAPALDESIGAGGIHILEVRTDRAANVELHNKLWSAVASAVR